MANPDFVAFLGEQSELQELISYDFRDNELRLPVGFLPRLRVYRSAVTRLVYEEESAPEAASRVVRKERIDIRLGGVMGDFHL